MYKREKMLRYALLCSIFILLIVSNVTISSSLAGESDFKVYDATLYENAPEMSRFNIDTIKIVYANEIWIDGLKYGEPLTDAILQESVKRIYKKINSDIKILCLDIEHWPLKADKETVNKSKRKYIDIVRRFKKLMPDKMIGLYGVIPIRNYYDALKINSPGYDAWTKQIDGISEIADEVDIFFPSLYTFRSNKMDWVKYAEANINQVKRFNKPVIPLIWPQYHQSNRFIGLSYISKDFWSLQLETIAKNADGVLVWGGWDVKKRKRQKWNAAADWWHVVKNFANNY